MPAKKAAKSVTKKTVAPVTTTPAKKTAKKASVAPAKKVARKAVSRKASGPVTKVTAKVDVGYGNTLFIRGEGGGLSWSTGLPMTCVSDDEWTWETTTAKGGLVFKFLVNDELWSTGDDLTVPAGGHSITEPAGFLP